MRKDYSWDIKTMVMKMIQGAIQDPDSSFSNIRRSRVSDMEYVISCIANNDIAEIQGGVFAATYIALPPESRRGIEVALGADENKKMLMTVVKAIAKYAAKNDIGGVWEGLEETPVFKDVFAETFAAPEESKDEED